ncbi:MAG TPA: ABC transporter ATP-binding protein [Gemmatimonadales bacterium]|nr:ABC transporter ATP-binding protein [Gemmatimonadales bacterium]
MSGAALQLERASVRLSPALPRQLDDVSLSVAEGECLALVGPNGAGKTTALRALLGLVALESGRASVFGREIGSWDRSELARSVGVVSQREEPVFPLLVAEAIAMGRYPYLGTWSQPSAADRDAVQRAMARADVVSLEHRWVETLSGGEWQRVRLARALAQEPRALVLDEPTASLDLRHEMELFELVIDLVRRENLAALVVSHHLNVAARFADRLVLMSAGRVVSAGAPSQVLTAETLSSVFGWPVSVSWLSDGTPQLYPERKPLKPLSNQE